MALLSLAGTAFGSVIGVLASNKLAMYRIEQLEKKVEKHNSVAERTAALERDMQMLYKLFDSERDE